MQALARAKQPAAAAELVGQWVGATPTQPDSTVERRRRLVRLTLFRCLGRDASAKRIGVDLARACAQACAPSRSIATRTSPESQPPSSAGRLHGVARCRPAQRAIHTQTGERMRRLAARVLSSFSKRISADCTQTPRRARHCPTDAMPRPMPRRPVPEGRRVAPRNVVMRLSQRERRVAVTRRAVTLGVPHRRPCSPLGRLPLSVAALGSARGCARWNGSTHQPTAACSGQNQTRYLHWHCWWARSGR